MQLLNRGFIGLSLIFLEVYRTFMKDKRSCLIQVPILLLALIAIYLLCIHNLQDL